MIAIDREPTCAKCGTKTLFRGEHRRYPPLDESRCGLDGRPSWDAETIAARWAPQVCPSCGHVAPDIGRTYPNMDVPRVASQFARVAALFGDADLREEGRWLLCAAWVDGEPRSVRRHAAEVLEASLYQGRALSLRRAGSQVVLAECLRTAGAFDRALAHVRLGSRMRPSAPERGFLVALADAVFREDVTPMTRGEASDRAQAMSSDQVNALIRRARGEAADLLPVKLRPFASVREPAWDARDEVAEAEAFARDFADQDLLRQYLAHEGPIAVVVTERPDLLPLLLRAFADPDRAVQKRAIYTFRQSLGVAKPLPAGAVVPDDPTIMEALVAQLDSDDDGHVRFVADLIAKLHMAQPAFRERAAAAARAQLPRWTRDLSTTAMLERLLL